MPDFFDYFMADHVVIGNVILDPLMGMDLLVVKTVPVIAFRAEYLHQTLLDKPTCRSYQTHVPVFVE
jgi:hypothetical protein